MHVRKNFSFLQSAWMNQEIFDLVHPDDADKIRDQLSATESPDAGRVLDLKSKDHCCWSVV